MAGIRKDPVGRNHIEKKMKFQETTDCIELVRPKCKLLNRIKLPTGIRRHNKLGI
jgi:hypothetical protein